MSLRRGLLLLLFACALAVPAAAEEWFEAYRAGVKALQAGQARKAVGLLEQAAAQRPQPGRNVITYGTNVEHEYHPYLRLAEAYIQLHDAAGARGALKQSERFAGEPPEERRRLLAQVDELAARLATPPPVPPSTLAAPPVTVPASAVASPEAPPVTTATLPPPSLAAQPTPLTPAEPRHSPGLHPSPAAAMPSSPPSSPSLAAGTLEVLSQPPGASVYLDDELVGTTDPEWGRLVRAGVPPGRHHLRLALAGYADVVEDVEVGAGRTDFRRRLDLRAAPVDRRFLLFGTVAALLLALTAWALWRPAGAVDRTARTPVLGREQANDSPTFLRTPQGMGSPGVRRDADGLDYFGEYRLVEPLGRGGMASVYKAERRGEIVALKRPLAAFLEEPEFLERFLREAEIGRTLHHPNIVRILERGEVEGVPFFTMELVAGETLQARLHREGALSPRVAASLVVQIAEALDYAHLKGVVHRDLKPSNVMVLPDDTCKVMDYGIARARRFEGLTVTGSFLGSPEYVAPEAIEGKSDARSDLYSLGVLFYECLTGRRPFAAATPFAVLRMHLTEAPAPPRALRPELPGELEEIVLRLLRKSPDERYGGAEDLVLELRDFLNRAA